MKPLDLDQAIVISAYTGIMCCNFSDLHLEVEKRLSRPVFTHEFASKEFFDAQVKPAFKDDFLALCNPAPPLGVPTPGVEGDNG
jgi:hypothetical protein